MKFDATITYPIILSFCALLSPSLTTFLNNRHQQQMRQLELEHEEKKTAKRTFIFKET